MKFCGFLLILVVFGALEGQGSPRIKREPAPQGEGRFLNAKLRSGSKGSTPSRVNRQRAERYDATINDYLTERTCWWNEMCKEEFSTKFKCKCPLFSYCSSPGKYYNAYCSMSSSGYLWTQPENPSKSFFRRRSYKGRRTKK